MIIMKKEIDYKNSKFTEKEIQEFCKQMGIITNVEVKKKK